MSENEKQIRNFCIIAHIDHGKSTLADRLLEITGTIEKRKMREQVLDSMELERERGITIKMTPVRMNYTLHPPEPVRAGATHYTLNLIDTPGHIDFSYEVSRALKAVEGAVLLVDATQGVQAQTISVLQMAREAGLVIIPVVNKVDSPLADIAGTKRQIREILGKEVGDILEVSGKTGQGVPELLAHIVEKVPPPTPAATTAGNGFRALIFDFKYSNHAGVVVYCRVFGGTVSRGERLRFAASGTEFTTIEAGIFSPEETAVEALGEGEIGYLITGVKEPGVASVGDTVLAAKGTLGALAGYDKPRPVVFASLYPESGDGFNELRQAIGRLRLSDSSFTYEEEASGLLGRGYRCGFLGMLHLEIVTERLRREFGLTLVVTTPSITYEITDKRGTKKLVYSAAQFPEYAEIAQVREPWVEAQILTPAEYLSALMPLLYEHEAILGATENFGEHRNRLLFEIPLRELMRGFFDEVKSASSGFASLSYKIGAMREADVVKLELLVADEVVPAFSRVVSRRRAELEAEKAVEKLHGILPRQLFAAKIQGKALGRIISSRTVRAMQKTLGDFGKNGGDRTRKMKLWQKQKEGKKRLQESGRVNIPPEIFLKMVQN